MENKIINFIGIDVAKSTLDVALIKNNSKEDVHSTQVANSIDGMKAMFKWLSENKVDINQSLFCMEHTGLYGKLPAVFIVSKTSNLWVEMPIKIIRSQGVTRGKTDRMDAVRIATYAMKNVADANFYIQERPVLEKIRLLIGSRDRLITAKVSLGKAAKEVDVNNQVYSKESLLNVKKSLAAIEKDIANIEKELDKTIKADEHLNKLFEVITSVPGVGKVTALFLLCFTNEFQNYNTGKQLACYCGVAPFEHSSGSSVRGKTRVHKMANKTLKKQLHMGALAAITYDPELRAYYLRKVAEGKHKMLVINNVRNKMVLRICSVVKRMQPYKKAA